jgi:Na+/phosphate symporter
MLPARKYWARYLLHLAIGFLAGLVAGGVVQTSTGVAGWSVTLATAGAVSGALLFMLRRDT